MTITKAAFMAAYAEWVEHKLIESIARGQSVEVDASTKQIFTAMRETIIKTAEQHRDFNRSLHLADVIVQKNRIVPVLVTKESLTT